MQQDETDRGNLDFAHVTGAAADSDAQMRGFGSKKYFGQEESGGARIAVI